MLTVNCIPLIPGRHLWACAWLKCRHTPKNKIINNTLFIPFI